MRSPHGTLRLPVSSKAPQQQVPMLAAVQSATCLAAHILLADDSEDNRFGPAVWAEGAPDATIDSILHAGDRRRAELIKHADLLIHDAQYTPEEYPAKKNCGHSTFS